MAAGTEHGFGHATVQGLIGEREAGISLVPGRKRVLRVWRAHGLGKGELAGRGLGSHRVVRRRGGRRGRVVRGVGLIDEIVCVDRGRLLAGLVKVLLSVCERIWRVTGMYMLQMLVVAVVEMGLYMWVLLVHRVGAGRGMRRLRAGDIVVVGGVLQMGIWMPRLICAVGGELRRGRGPVHGGERAGRRAGGVGGDGEGEEVVVGDGGGRGVLGGMEEHGRRDGAGGGDRKEKRRSR